MHHELKQLKYHRVAGRPRSSAGSNSYAATVIEISSMVSERCVSPQPRARREDAYPYNITMYFLIYNTHAHAPRAYMGAVCEDP